MKIFYSLFLSIAALSLGYSQKASPAKTAKAMVGKTEVVINYSSPSKKERVIFGELVPYDKIWRTGANEATTFEVSTNVTLNGEELEKGKYALFTIPGEEEWTVILNNQSKQWGAYNHEEENDVLTFTVPAQATEEMMESFTIMVNEEGLVTLAWDMTKIEFMVKS